MSKIRDLRRQAQQELRAHRFDKAVALYQRICESEKSNAGYRNELGDIYLKMGELPQAVLCFREAASLYRDVGLTNNAVAILKKVLRQDPHHFDSLWELGEIRSEQGLETEAVRSFLDYLRTADAVPEDGRESFLRRSAEVLDRWGQEPEVLAELDSLFERWGADQERAQVLVAKAALARSEGEEDMAEKYVEHARQAFPELDALPAYVAYLEGDGPGDLPTGLSGELPLVGQEEDDPDDSDDPQDRMELDEEVLDLGFDFDEEDLSGAIESSRPHEPIDAGEEGDGPDERGDDVDDSGPVPEFEIPDEVDPQALDLGPTPTDDSHDVAEDAASDDSKEIVLDDSPSDPAETLPEDEAASGPVESLPEDDAATGPVESLPEDDAATGPAETLNEDQAPSGASEPLAQDETPRDEGAPPDPEVTPDESSESGAINLLDEILSDGDVDFSSQERNQIDTIASEVEGQMAGNVDPSDHAGQYDLGMVYADMGLLEQAVTAFLRAAESEAFRLRALEMAGGCRLEAGDLDGAIEVLERGLEVQGHSESAYVGLLFFLGRAHEERGDRDRAIENFERVALIDAGFKGVAERLKALHDQPAQL